jgi:hypothetical protein
MTDMLLIMGIIRVIRGCLHAHTAVVTADSLQFCN